jgi:hypothetical protein
MSTKSDAYFVVSAIIVHEDFEYDVRSELAGLRKTLHRHAEHVLHFQNLTHAQRLKAAQEVAGFSIARITSVIVAKRPLAEPLPEGRMAHISRPDPLYLWALGLTLERISWYCRKIGRQEAIVTFAHIQRFRTEKLTAYRKRLENDPRCRADWSVFAGHPFRMAQPGEVELLQVADTAASATYHAVEPNEYGNRETSYLRALAPMLLRGPMLDAPQGPVTSYGLKVFPTREAEHGGSLHWLRDY